MLCLRQSAPLWGQAEILKLYSMRLLYKGLNGSSTQQGAGMQTGRMQRHGLASNTSRATASAAATARLSGSAAMGSKHGVRMNTDVCPQSEAKNTQRARPTN